MQPIGMMVACAWVRLTVLESFFGGCLPPGSRLPQTLRGKFLLYFCWQHLLGHTYGVVAFQGLRERRKKDSPNHHRLLVRIFIHNALPLADPAKLLDCNHRFRTLITRQLV
jgi:hypothetical protein